MKIQISSCVIAITPNRYKGATTFSYVQYPLIVTDRRLEVMGTWRAVHKRHRVAGRQSHTTARGAREVSSEDNVPRGSAVHHTRTARPDNRKMQHEQGCHVSDSPWHRRARVNYLKTFQCSLKCRHLNTTLFLNNFANATTIEIFKRSKSYPE